MSVCWEVGLRHVPKRPHKNARPFHIYNMLNDGHSAHFRPPFVPRRPPPTPSPPKPRLCQVDDELAKECSAPGGAGVLGALSRIIQRHGKAGLWRGMVPVLITMGVSNFVYFYCFNGMKVCCTYYCCRAYLYHTGGACLIAQRVCVVVA